MVISSPVGGGHNHRETYLRCCHAVALWEVLARETQGRKEVWKKKMSQVMKWDSGNQESEKLCQLMGLRSVSMKARCFPHPTTKSKGSQLLVLDGSLGL